MSEHGDGDQLLNLAEGQHNRYQNVVALVFDQPWLIMPEKLEQIAAVLQLRMQGVRFTDEEISAKTGDVAPRRNYSVTDAGIGVLPVYGVLQKRAGIFDRISGATGTTQLLADFRSMLADKEIKGIVFDHDSPGGSVFGPPELAAAILAVRGQKPMVAMANALSASGSYWVASAADEVIVLPEGQIGSIGVISVLRDVSRALDRMGATVNVMTAGKYKAAGNPYEPLGNDARAYLQAKLDTYYGQFIDAVRLGRPQLSADVTQWADGKVFIGKQAVAVGLADRTGTLDGVVHDLAARVGSGSRPVSVAVGAVEVPVMAKANWDAGQKAFVLDADAKKGEKIDISDGVLTRLMESRESEKVTLLPTAKDAPVVDVAAEANKALAAERDRVANIYALCSKHGLSALAEELIVAKTPLPEASQKVIAALEAKYKSVGTGVDQSAQGGDPADPNTTIKAEFAALPLAKRQEFKRMGVDEAEYVAQRRWELGLETLAPTGNYFDTAKAS